MQGAYLLAVVILIIAACCVMMYGFEGGQFLHSYVSVGPPVRTMQAVVLTRNTFPGNDGLGSIKTMAPTPHMGRPPTIPGNKK